MAATDDILGLVQRAIVATLTADTTFMSKVTGVYDQAPIGAQFPYVTVGETLPTSWDAFSKRGRMVLTTVHVWTRFEGFGDGDAIVADLNRLLDRATPTLSGLAVVYCKYEDANPMRDPDGITRHIPVRYRILVQEA